MCDFKWGSREMKRKKEYFLRDETKTHKFRSHFPKLNKIYEEVLHVLQEYIAEIIAGNIFRQIHG